MSVLHLPRRFYSQPPGWAEIDWSNPITDGLIVAVNGATLIDHVSGKPLTITNNNGRSSSINGLSANFNNSMYGSIPISWSGGPFTLLAVGRCTADTSNDAYCSVGNSGSSANDVLIYRAATNDCSYLFSRTSGSFVQTSAVDSSNLTDRFYTLAGVTYSSTDRRLFVDGVQLSNSTASLSIASNINTFYYGAHRTSGTASNFFDGQIPVAMLFGRALSAGEVKSISANPWQIFKAK